MAEKRKMTGRESLSTVHPETRKKRLAAAKKKAASGRKAGVGERDMEEGGAKFRGPAAARSRARNPKRAGGDQPRPVDLRSKQRGAEDEGGIASKGKKRVAAPTGKSRTSGENPSSMPGGMSPKAGAQRMHVGLTRARRPVAKHLQTSGENPSPGTRGTRPPGWGQPQSRRHPRAKK